MSIPLRSPNPSASVVTTHFILQTHFMLLSFSLTSQIKTFNFSASLRSDTLREQMTDNRLGYMARSVKHVRLP
jgi:hypothetical protein